MDNVFKEILKLYKDDDIEYYNMFENLEVEEILDYITNLQKKIQRLNNVINELEKYHIKSIENLENTEDFKYVGTNHIKILYEEHKRTLDKLKELKEVIYNE